ncbi:MAG: endonuclease III domain-containing protein [Candidatus Helarchaeota archaeon]
MDDYILKELSKKILNWFYEKWKNGINKYPWRYDNTAPYEILIAEILLQHTTAKAIIDNLSFERFIKKFPDFYSIKNAKIEEIEEIFKPIGLYHQKATRLKKLANEICLKYDGKIPNNKKELLLLPGIGEYIANAVLTFAFNKNEVPLDGNLKRICKNVWNIDKKFEQKLILKKLADLNPKKIYWALFDIGRFHCRKPKPICVNCPFIEICKNKT